MNLENKKILVTGGAGFIGSHLVDRLIEMGAKVIVIDDLSTGKKKNVNKEAQLLRCNTNSRVVERIFQQEKFELVFHLAGNTNVPLSVKDPIYDFKGLSGGLKIAEYSRKSNVEKFIFCSSGFIYGNVTKRPTLEEEAFTPISPYAISKKALEDYLIFFHEIYKLPLVIFRFSTIYGPRQIKGAMADYIFKLNDNKQAEIFGRNPKTRDYVFVRDAIDALERGFKVHKRSMPIIFNIASGKETSLLDVYKKIAEILDKPAKPIFKPLRKGELVGYSLDSSRAKKFLSWVPRISFEEGLRLTIESHLK